MNNKESYYSLYLYYSTNNTLSLSLYVDTIIILLLFDRRFMYFKVYISLM
jgi:hypothetical protein